MAAALQSAVCEREGALVAFDGAYRVTLVTLAPIEGWDAPWTEKCEGCDGSGVAHAGVRLEGPCSSCWGSGRVLFAFEPDNMPCAVVVPPVIAQPWIARSEAS